MLLIKNTHSNICKIYIYIFVVVVVVTHRTYGDVMRLTRI